MTNEMAGWHRFAADEQWSDPPDDYLLWLPRPRQAIPSDTLHWEWHADSFDRGLNAVEVRGRFVLDLAAGRCWTTRWLAEQGADCVATDMVLTDHIGLKTGKRYIRHTGKFFERIACNLLDLPFADGTFDIVFGYAALHHCEDLPRAIREAVRVLKPGGDLVLAGEPVGRFYEPVARRFRRNAYQINETSPVLAEWIRPLKREGLERITLFKDPVFTTHSTDVFDRLFRPLVRCWDGFYRIKLLSLGGVLIVKGSKTSEPGR